MEHNESLKEIVKKFRQLHKEIENADDLDRANALRGEMIPILTSLEYHISSPIHDWKTKPIVGDVLEFLANLESHVSDDWKSNPIIGNVLKLSKVGLRGSVALKDSLDVSIGVSNSALLLANALSVDFDVLTIRGSANGNGKQFNSRFRERFETTHALGDRLIADERGIGLLVEVDNPSVWRGLNSAIIGRVDDAFSAKDDNVTKLLEDESVNLNQPLVNPIAGVDTFTQEIINNMLIHIPEDKTNHLDAKILADLIKEFAKTSVASMLVQCLNVPEIDKDGNLIVNGTVLPDTIHVNVSKMQLATYMSYGVNERQTKAKKNLEEWIKLKGIKKENLSFPWIDGQGKDGLDEMIGEVSKNYFIGLCKTNWALAEHLDPMKLEKVCPTKNNSKDTSRWDEYVDRFKNLGQRPISPDGMPVEEPKVMRQFRDQKKFHDENEPKAEKEEKVEHPVPFRAFAKVYQIATRIIQSQISLVRTSDYIDGLFVSLEKKPKKIEPANVESKLCKLKANMAVGKETTVEEIKEKGE